MAAAPPGTVTMFVSDGAGDTITTTIHFDPNTLAFSANPAISVTSTFPTRQALIVVDQQGVSHSADVPTGTTNISPAQLSAFGGVTSMDQIDGVTLAL